MQVNGMTGQHSEHRLAWSLGYACALLMFVLLHSAGVRAAPLESSPHQPHGTTRNNPRQVQREARLQARLHTHGTAKLLVAFRAADEPFASLRATALQTGAERREQPAAIARLQTRLLTRRHFSRPHTVKRFAHIPYLALEADANDVAALRAHPDVVDLHEDRRCHSSLDVSAPLVGATLAWKQGSTGQGEVITILDTGVDKTHGFLAGKVISEACYSTTYEPDRTTLLCPGGTETAAQRSPLQSDTGVGVPCTLSGCYHGTHVADIAAGNGSLAAPPVPFSGVAKDARLIAIQVFSRVDSGGWLTPCRSAA